MNGITKHLPNVPKRRKLAVALDKYPDVIRMWDRYVKGNPGHNPTYIVITSLRAWLVKQGVARKKDVQP